jgi:enamine deaminase RidA (YjgF/YER057c/UK114 family)
VGRKQIDPPDVFDSRRYGFSQAVATSGGDTIHVSGQVGWDRDENLVGADLASQTHQAFDNLATVLAAAGATMADVVALRIYIVEAAGDDHGPVGDALRARFPAEAPPASSWIVVAGLAGDGLLIEVEATAFLGG